MHKTGGKTDKGHFITMDGRINGEGSTLVFDTGAGFNIISSRQASDYGLRMLDTTYPMIGIGGDQQGQFAMADTLHIGGMAWANVPFLIIDLQTGNTKADSLGTLLPPVIGQPIMRCMKEIQLDFEHQMFIVPAVPTPRPFKESNLLRNDTETLHFATTDKDGQSLYFLLDTGGYYTTLTPHWYEQHKDEVQAIGTPDSLGIAGIGGIKKTRAYRLPHKEFRIGNGTAVLDSVIVDTGIYLHSYGVKTKRTKG